MVALTNIVVDNSESGSGDDTQRSMVSRMVMQFDAAPSGLDVSHLTLKNRTELQSIVHTATSGSMTLTFDGETTSSLAYNATAAQVESALAALSNVGSGNVKVVGAPKNYLVIFRGALADADLPAITASGITCTITEQNNGLAGPDLSLSVSGNDATVTFSSNSGCAIVGGSLPDGNWILTLDGDSAGIDGGEQTHEFHRFFGDQDGDRDVDATDYFQFNAARTGTYKSWFDYNSDSTIDLTTDYPEFQKRMGRKLWSA